MRIRMLLRMIFVASSLALAPGLLPGQTLFSYLDESGVRIFTNIPPKAPVRDLVVSGRPLPAPQPEGSAAPETPYDPIITKYASQFQVDPSLIKSMIAKESAFNPRAVSSKGAEGLMQLMPATAARHGVRNSFDPEENIRGGVKHMRLLLDTFDNDVTLSLAAYNAGENLVARLGRVPNIKETTDYVRTITKRYGKQRMEPPAEATVKPPLMFRFLDENGTLHLTNLPPVQRSATYSGGWASSQP